MIGILTWVAEREREMLVQRTKDGMRRAKDSGKVVGRPVKVIDKILLSNYLQKILLEKKPVRTLGISKATLYKEIGQISKGCNTDTKIWP